MTVDYQLALSPLADWAERFAALPPVITLREFAFRLQLNLRVDPQQPAAQRIALVLGGPLPTVACTAKTYGEREVLWLGPDEWLVVADPQDSQLEAAIGAAIGDDAGAVTDVSGQRTALHLSGPAAGEVLTRGCAIDLHRQVAPAGTCVQTLIARTGVTIVVRDDTATRYLLLVRASFADYLAAWLVDACTELRS